MPVSSLLERMRKKLQEKSAATSTGKNNAGDGSANTAAASSTAVGADPNAPSTTASAGTQGVPNAISSSAPASSSSPSSSHPSTAGAATHPLPPPVFASPSSARLDYRDAVGDPLCAPFTSSMAASIVQQVLLQLQPPPHTSGYSASGHPSSDAETTRSGGDGAVSESDAARLRAAATEVPPTGRAAAVVQDNVVQHLTEVLAFDKTRSRMECIAGGSTVANTPASAAPASLLEDVAYAAACARSRMDVSGRLRAMCRDVNYYSRVGRISQGVYGVVFRAVAAAPEEEEEEEEDDDDYCDGGMNTSRPHRRHRLATASAAPLSSPRSPAARRSYALKHIKKMWLEESQIGFPPYLLREIDLLLRLRHPNVMGARELVLLDPTPLPTSVNPQVVRQTEGAGREREEGEGEGEGGVVARKRRRDGGACEEGIKAEEGFSNGSPASASARREGNAGGPPGPAGATGSSTTATASADAKPLAALGAVSETKDVFLVMDFCPFDLTTYMRRYHTTPTCQIPFFHVTPRNAHPGAAENYVARAKSIAYQLFRAVAFLHANRVMHRDLKTSNVLLSENGYVKVCDFGLGRLYREGQGLTPTVVTLMYRAPELHLGVADYSHKMDVWSVGCIVAELFLRRPLFYAATDSHHLLAVCDVLGIPTEETFPALYHLPQTKVMMQSLPRWNRTPRLAELFKPGATVPSSSGHGEAPVAAEAALLPPEGLELLQSILQWNPRRRPSAAEVLRHPFFHTAPLPCPPAELMRPMPWQDAVAPPPSRLPPPVEVRVPAVVPLTEEGTELAGVREATAAGDDEDAAAEREVRLAQMRATQDEE